MDHLSEDEIAAKLEDLVKAYEKTKAEKKVKVADES